MSFKDASSAIVDGVSVIVSSSGTLRFVLTITRIVSGSKQIFLSNRTPTDYAFGWCNTLLDESDRTLNVIGWLVLSEIPIK